MDTKIDPITFALIKNALDIVVDEMAYTLIRTARSEIVKDVMDFSTAFCDAGGLIMAQGRTIALHIGSIPAAIEHVLAAYDDNLHPGDVVILNDPYSGGMHLPDVFMFRPVFHDGQRQGFVVAIAHQTDMGGRVAGSNASDSTEIFQEGLRIPPLKLYERGVPNDTLHRLIALNVRVPDRVLGDLKAQHAACSVGEKEFLKLLRRYGADVVRMYMGELLDYAERMTREEIRRWPKGTVEFTDYVDDDGFQIEPIPINVRMTVHEDSLTVDFTGSSPQVKGAINATASFTKSATYFCIRAMLRADVPENAGVFRCIQFQIPRGSVLNPEPPAACAARALTGYRVVDAVLGALAQILPERVPAACEGGNSVACFGGYTEQRKPFIVVEMICGTGGGRPTKDGIDGVTNPSQNLSNTPVEILEAQHPIRIEEYSFVPDSCGAGRWRGGLGICREYVLLNYEATLQIRSDRVKFRPYGLAGGKSGSPSRTVLNPRNGAKELSSKVLLTVHQGDVIRHQQAGGGGFGDALERDPERVARDVRDEKVSLEFARREHGVVLHHDTLTVDLAATAALRAQLRQKGASTQKRGG